MLQRYAETQRWSLEKRRVATLFFSRQKGNTAGSHLNDSAPTPWFHILMKVLHFFSFAKFQNSHGWHRAAW